MNTSKKVAATEADQALAQSHLSNGLDLMIDHDMVGATTETEVMTTVEATDVEEVGVAVMEATRGLVVEGDPAVDMGEVVVEVTAVDVEEGVVTMIDEIIVAEEGEVVMVVEVMVAVEDIGSISHRTANTSLPSSKGHGSNRTMASNITVIRSNQAVSRTTSLNNSNSPSSSSSMDRDHLTTSTTTTTRDTKQPQDTNRLDMHNSNSTAKLHSNPSNRGLTRITKTTTQDINSKRAMAVTVAQGISRLALIKGITRN